LVIGARQGQFAGMLLNRTFRIVPIGTSNAAAQVVHYTGAKVEVKL
jgi:alpha-D-xyloside xylohydrolase